MGSTDLTFDEIRMSLDVLYALHPSFISESGHSIERVSSPGKKPQNGQLDW